MPDARDFFAGDFKKAIDAKDWRKVRERRMLRKRMICHFVGWLMDGHLTRMGCPTHPPKPQVQSFFEPEAQAPESSMRNNPNRFINIFEKVRRRRARACTKPNQTKPIQTEHES